jgi:hypothetical protein
MGRGPAGKDPLKIAHREFGAIAKDGDHGILGQVRHGRKRDGGRGSGRLGPSGAEAKEYK